MAEYIEREEYCEKYCRCSNEYCDKKSCPIWKAPAADIAPVVHSYWEHKITSNGEEVGICHNCKYPISWYWEITKYCPNCGAKMDGGVDNASG